MAAHPAASRLHLVLLSSSGIATHVLPAHGEVRIGRAEDCEVRIDDEALSRHHAAIRVSPNGLTVLDLGSANGTFIDGRRLATGAAVGVSLGGVIVFANVTAMIQQAALSSRVRLLRSHEYFLARLEEECGRAAANGTTFSVLSIRGEVSATKLPILLTSIFGASDVIATYSPGEYEVLVPDADRASVTALSTSLLTQLEAEGIVATVGVALYPEHARVAAALVDISRHGAPPPLASRPRVVRPIGALERLRPITERVAASDINVLILGETGVGKELLATMVHDLSPRRAQPIVAVNCASLGDALFESELFGHERGAFTGAVTAKPGLLESADGGSVFLDEVGEMTLTAQAKILRVLERREVTRVGALRPRPIDVRFIAATNRDLESEVERGTFRQDLYFRLNGMTLILPPLRERVDEIEQLATAFVAQLCASTKRSVVPRIASDAMDVLRRHDWPGNVRELKNSMERAVILCTDDVIRLRHLRSDLIAARARHDGFASDGAIPLSRRPTPNDRPATIPPAVPAEPAPASASFGGEPTPATGSPAFLPLSRGFDGSEAERQKIEAALAICGGNQGQAARMLGVSRGTLVTRLEQYGFPRPRKPNS